MAQENIVRCLGLITQYNPLSIQPGALARASNAVIDRENIIENRRGYALYGTVASTLAQLVTYRNRVLGQYSTSLAYDNGSGTFTAYSGSYSPPSGVKMRSALAKNNLYVTTSAGVKVFSDVAGTAARLAGTPRSLDPSYTLTGASGYLANNAQSAYRCVIQRTDANLNTITGYPSQRLWVANAAGGTRNVILTVYLTSDTIAGDTVQFFRTVVDTTSATSDTAGDTMALAYQVTLKAADITAGFITFTDSIVDALLGTPLYTNATQEGIAQGNAIPPLAKDIALYRSSFLFYANTQTKQRLNFTLVGTSGLSGKTITLAGTTYNFGASEIVSGGGSPQAIVGATGVAAVDIDSTARSLVRVINRYASNTAIYAYYLSGPSDLPGQIAIEERGVGAAAYTIQGSDTTIAGMFFPQPPVSPATATASTSSNEAFTNRLYYSKGDQPEHVPLLNYLPVGPSNTAILRIAALRDSLIVIKEEGVYRLTGQTISNFSVVPLDLTVACKAIDSVAVLQNQVYMLSNQGVVAISDTGVQVISREIEASIRPLIPLSNLAGNTVAVSYESDRSYFLSTISGSTDTTPMQIFRFNIFTQAWTKWSFGFTAAVVESSTDKLFFTLPALANVYRERKDFADTDYSDPDVAITISAIGTNTVTFTISGVTPLAGWGISQGGTTIATSAIVASGAGFMATLFYNAPSSWTTGAAIIQPYVGFDIEWNVWSASQPGVLKQLQQVELLTDNISGNHSATQLIGSYKTDLDQNTETVSITSGSYRWGSAPWGAFSWGGISDNYAYPTWPPLNKSYGRLFFLGVQHARANEHVSIAGLSLTYVLASERVSK